MPVASMAAQTQMGERIKEELGSLLGPYPAKQRMNASLLNFSVFRDRYTKPLVSGQRVICTFPPPLGSAPRAASLSPDNAVHRFLYPLLSSSKNKEINQVFLFVSCNLGYRHFKTPSPCWLYRQRGGGQVGKLSFFPSFVTSAPVPCGRRRDGSACARRGGVMMG